MTLLIDKRDLEYDRFARVPGAEVFLAETARVAESVQHTLIAEGSKVNRFTGHLTELRVEGAPAVLAERAGGETSDGDYIARAKEYLSSVSGAIGFAAGEPADFEADPKVTSTSGGMRVVSLQQTLNGIEVWGMAPKVWLREDGTVDRVVGDTASVPGNVPTMPTVPVETALAAGVEKAAEPVTVEGPFGTDELPRLDVSTGFGRLSAQARNDQPMTFEAGAFDKAIPARLVYFYMGDDVRLVWSFAFSRANGAVQYHVLVEADDKAADVAAPQVLLLQDLTNHVIGGLVFRQNPVDTGFSLASFPLPLTDYPVEPPSTPLPGFPGSWTTRHDGHVATVGNNVRAVDGKTGKSFEIEVDQAGNGVFAPVPETPDQLVTNIFFFCNLMHDYFVMLGFTEEHGNFQTVNFSGHGLGADPVVAQAHPNPVFGTANMSTPPDGMAAEMNMGLVDLTGRHTANDANVVFHEYTHGVTNRLVGGLHDAAGLRENQSRAMGEGWSDYFALTIPNFSHEDEHTVVGDWVIADPRGIRQRPYDDQYPGDFGKIGRLGAGLDYTKIHNVGEIWCAALMEMTRRISSKLGSKERGYRTAWQAVVDGLKLTPKNPSFLTARDAILRALRDLRGKSFTEAEYPEVRLAAWGSFARYGMGFDASCPNASFVGCQAGSLLPPDGHED
ncbi:M36 family metallopeptidase [Streptomyces sp. ME08-AFT2]|uniref:M36 family metallopeptidase n=1 Tax=Streptomyces sp. ME08-AFT2 TaxID=3028683 RepID=UPI0029A2EA9E|nr:M36 family metallopeptidase [Streptomyces sp. ME08-AFT2]MDX3310747.1 M36 family metallopeptidase [Streptomyces sp. ME08-AFT2]